MPNSEQQIDWLQLQDRLSTTKVEKGQLKRVFHGRGQTFSGLGFINVDFYGSGWFVTVFRELEDEALQQLTDILLNTRLAVFVDLVDFIVVQYRQGVETKNISLLAEPPQQIIVTENGKQFITRIGRGQNTGIFPDMLNGRQWVEDVAANKQVLNLFSYTCAFSIAALKGGANCVVNVDMNKSAMALGQQNHKKNNLDLNKTKFLSHNIFKSWGKIRKSGPYDLIIIDPPSFQKGSFVLTSDYQKLLRRIPELASPQADVLLCVNAPEVGTDFLHQQVQAHCPSLKFVNRIENHQDFPEIDDEKSLKAMIFKYETEK